MDRTLVPRYSMGIGFAEGLVSKSPAVVRSDYFVGRSSCLCCIGGGYGEFLFRILMNLKPLKADCVFPTRTARFGVALTFKGPLNLREHNVEHS
jgi:hypothetical protein